jgi:hypothetical protein
MNDIVFVKQNGGMGRPAASEDPVSGLIVSPPGLTGAELWAFDPIQSLTYGDMYVAKITYASQLIDFGIEETSVADLGLLAGGDLSWAYVKNWLAYNVGEFFRMSPSGTLYLGVKPAMTVYGRDVRNLQYYAGGSIRQTGVFADAATITSGLFNDLQASAAELEDEHQPLSILAGLCATTGMTKDNLQALGYHAAGGYGNISLLVGCDLDPEVEARTGVEYLGRHACIGNLLGCVSRAAVNESVAWVQKFPLGLTMPGLVTGEPVKEVSPNSLALLDDARLIFARTHTGAADCYYNDGYTLDQPTSDYAYIENVRTMDKATRGIRAALLPYLNAPLYVDAESGKLRADTVAVLENAAGRALEDMEKAGELSGYRAEIDPEQDVLATSEVVAVIRNVPVGVMRRVTVKIGYAAKLS